MHQGTLERVPLPGSLSWAHTGEPSVPSGQQVCWGVSQDSPAAPVPSVGLGILEGRRLSSPSTDLGPVGAPLAERRETGSLSTSR